MILVDQKLNVQTSSNVQSNNFTIKASPKAFAILSAKLYSKPIIAIVRELSTNAADAMTAANQTLQPFEVHLPNQLEPWFSILDNGIGMSHEKIMGLYTTYFGSDKTDSNEFTGCLGLGSKTPFAYANQFTVESRHNGVCRTYCCYISQDGFPCISLLNTENTSDSNGFFIKFSVQQKDFKEFTNAAQQVYQYFKIKPIIKGTTQQFNFNKEYLIKTDKFGLFKCGMSGSSAIIMGNVGYEFDHTDLENVGYKFETYQSEHKTYMYYKLISHGLEIYCNIGDVNIAANRESVNYDNQTIELIMKTCDNCIEIAKQQIVDEINKKSTDNWTKRKLIYNYQTSILNKCLNVSKLVNINPYLEPAKWKPGCMAYKIRNRKRYRIFKEIDQICPDDSPIFYIDLKGGMNRIRKHCKNNSINRGYIIQNVDWKCLQEEGLDKIVILASSLPKITHVKIRTSSRNAKSTLNLFNGGNSIRDCWEKNDVEIKNGGVYINFFRGQPLHDNGTLFDLSTLIKVMMNIRLFSNFDLYGVRPKDISKLEKYKNWISLEKYIEKIISQNEDLRKDAELLSEYVLIDSNIINFIRGLADLCKKSNFIQEFKNNVENVKKSENNNKYKCFKYLNKIIMKWKINNQNGFMALIEKIYNKYPLLRNATQHNNTIDKKHYADYVNMIEEKSNE